MGEIPGPENAHCVGSEHSRSFIPKNNYKEIDA